jgi:hypothetical protein
MMGNLYSARSMAARGGRASVPLTGWRGVRASWEIDAGGEGRSLDC